MSSQGKVKPEIALAIAIGIGIAFGILIKRFKIGLMLGVFASLLYVMIVSARKKK